MRIGFGSTVLGRGLNSGHLDGIGVYAQALWRVYRQKGIDITPYAFGRGGDAAPLGAATRSFRMPYTGQAAVSYLTGLPFAGAGRMRRDIDVFHAPDHHIPKLPGVPVVATLMDAIPLLHPEWASSRLRAVKNAVFKHAASWADQIVTISEYSAGDLVNAFGVERERITAIPLAVDPAFFERVPDSARAQVLAKYGLRPGFFIFIGTLQPRKNVERIILAHRQLAEPLRRERPLVIVGQNGWGTDGLLPELARLERDRDGKWLRYVPRDDLFALIQSAGALVYPSLYEGFGLPVLEGFASQIPVITANTTSLPEVAGDAALLVDPTRCEAIADAMRRVGEDTELAQHLVAWGKERVAQFSWEKCAEATLAVYRKAMRG